MLYTGLYFFFFFFNDTATTEIYTLSLHDALPILRLHAPVGHEDARDADGDEAEDADESRPPVHGVPAPEPRQREDPDRKSTRLNSSHANISYAVFCLKKKKKK